MKDIESLVRQLTFVKEIDKLKKITRQAELIDGSRKENTAEHSWHCALMAFILESYAREKVDILKVTKMLLVHDIVEIDAGDTCCYDMKNNKSKEQREEKAANRIFSLLPEKQRQELYSLWTEFEEKQTPESQFANTMDRLQPLIQNFESGGRFWREWNVTKEMALKRSEPIKNWCPKLWPCAENIIEQAIKNGWIKK